MRIRKDSLIPEKLKNTGMKLFEVIRCQKPSHPEINQHLSKNVDQAPKFDFSGLQPNLKVENE